MSIDCAASNSRGVSLVELIVFIVVVSAGVAGILAVLSETTRTSADPLIQRQALAIAQSLIEEIELMPFTWCDPDDPQAATATGAFVGPAGCAAALEAIGPEAGETRYGGAAAPFDNVNDYHGYDSAAETPAGVKDITGAAIPALAGFAVAVSVAPAGLGGIAAPDALLVTVTVTGPANTVVTLQGYRTRHAPNAVP